MNVAAEWVSQIHHHHSRPMKKLIQTNIKWHGKCNFIPSNFSHFMYQLSERESYKVDQANDLADFGTHRDAKR